MYADPQMTDPARDIDALRAQFVSDLAGATGEPALRAVRDRYLARKGGLVSGLLRGLGVAPADERPRLGQLVNALKAEIEAAIDERLATVSAARPPRGAVDVTLPGRLPAAGHRHPLTLLRERIESIFSRMGFLVIEGPELEDDYHNFEALNMPAEHPARDMQDTLYLATPLGGHDPQNAQRAQNPPHGIDDPRNTPKAQNSSHSERRKGSVNSVSSVDRVRGLLRTHTSAMQIRHMEENDPPVRLIAMGPVYRRDNLDLTHTPMFHQCEGLVVGPNITLADLKGTLLSMARALFGPDQEVRFRPSFFPYTEPSAEVDIRCIRCEGHGCAICKRTGWLEILGSGMVHPAVFEYVGYDPEQVTGFAFGMGLERVAILKWNVDDIRLFYENDLRFLEQFGQ